LAALKKLVLVESIAHSELLEFPQLQHFELPYVLQPMVLSALEIMSPNLQNHVSNLLAALPFSKQTSPLS